MKTFQNNKAIISTSQLKKAPREEAGAGHRISRVKGQEIHWMQWGENEIHIFNAGSVMRHQSPFGAKVAFLTT